MTNSRSTAKPSEEIVGSAGSSRPFAPSIRPRPRTREDQAADLAKQITDAVRLREQYLEQAETARENRREHLLRRAAAQEVRQGKARRKLAKIAPSYEFTKNVVSTSTVISKHLSRR